VARAAEAVSSFTSPENFPMEARPSAKELSLSLQNWGLNIFPSNRSRAVWNFKFHAHERKS
jgi:hypothetical protein